MHYMLSVKAAKQTEMESEESIERLRAWPHLAPTSRSSSSSMVDHTYSVGYSWLAWVSIVGNVFS